MPLSSGCSSLLPSLWPCRVSERKRGESPSDKPSSLGGKWFPKVHRPLMLLISSLFCISGIWSESILLGLFSFPVQNGCQVTLA